MNENKIVGKTYTLYGDQDISDYFYEDLIEVTDSILKKVESKLNLIDFLRKNSGNKRSLRKEIKINPGKTLLDNILNLTENTLSKYFTDLDSHLKNLTLSEKCGSTLATSREQYLLYMLEIELVNRVNKDKFNLAEMKFAFLPHCLHDLDKDCLSAFDGTDYVCKSCSKNCSINLVSKLIKLRDIKAYIWREADLKKIFKLAKSSGQSISAFGVACIPELVNGLRLCAKYDVSAIGVPLDANRYVRWMGDFYPNSVNQKKILSLLN
ncbi:MAG: DUF116 domain-containing protein [Ignavibacteriaceae bacterium]|nr:DUF116 domain-containing protein [Ignavibacteriaceae bacterium]